MQFRLLFTKLRHFEKKWHAPFYLIGHHLESVSRTEPVFVFKLAPSEKNADLWISVWFSHFFLSSYHVNVTNCNLCARAKVKGHVKIEENTSFGKLVKPFILVAVLVSDLWAMADKSGTVFDNWPPFWMCHSDRTGCWTRVSPNWMEAISSISAQFRHMPERYERVRVGWHCAKVKCHAELKIEKQPE